MAKSCKTNKILKRNKKGVALAYTLIASMVLMILTTALFTAAGSNISLSAKNSDARKSYITCKSAVEYAKSVLLQRASAARDANKARENSNLANSTTEDPTNTAESVGNQIKGTTMLGFLILPDNTPTATSGFQIDDLGKPRGDDYAVCEVSLQKVIRTTIQAVTTCDTQNADKSYPVTAQRQTRINTLKDNTKSINSKNWDAGTTTNDVTQTSSTTAPFTDVTQILSVRDEFIYHIKITAASKYESSGRMQRLNYETDCTIGGTDAQATLKPSPVPLSTATQNPVTVQTLGTQMAAVGGHYGEKSFTNGDHLGPSGNGSSKLPFIFKNEMISSGSDSYLSAPAVYFMNGASISVEDMLQVPLRNQKCATIDSDFIYFNGNINGIQDAKNSTCSALVLKNSRNSLKLKNDYIGVVQFNNTIITLQPSDGSRAVTKKYDGYYYFKDSINLFDFNAFDSHLEKVPQADYQTISGVANPNYVGYLQSNINNVLSGDLSQYDSTGRVQNEGTGWVQNGDISNGTPSVPTDKTVYCYANRCDTWVNTFNNHPNVVYGAKNIVFQWDSDSALKVPNDKTVTFQADYIVIHTNQIIKSGDASSQFIVKSVNNNSFAMVFPTDTVIQYANSRKYTIKAGTYGAVPNNTNLFSKNAEAFFTNMDNHSYDGISGTVGAFVPAGVKLEDAAAPNFLLYGAKYGANSNPWVYDNVNTPRFIDSSNGKNGFSAYPVLFNQSVRNDSGAQPRDFYAPQAYFMGTGNSIFCYGGGSSTIHSNFIYITGNVWQEGNSSIKLYSYADIKKGGIICFANTCTIYCKSEKSNYSIEYPKGYYYFAPGTDLFHLTIILQYPYFLGAELKSMNKDEISKAKVDNYVDYIEKQHNNVISGDSVGNAPTVPYNAAANWAPNGVLNSNSSVLSGKDAYLYVNSTSDWGTAAANYQAARINLQYVNSGALTVPGGKKVTFTASDISLNGQASDIGKTDDKLVLQQGDIESTFVVKTPHGTGYVTITLPHDLYVNDSSGNLIYKVPAGVYKVKNNTDLFGNPFAPVGPSSITLPELNVNPNPPDLFVKGKYTNE